MNTERIERIQSVLQELNIPAWLFYGFHQNDPFALRILGLPPDLHATRRWFYLVPSRGEPRKLVHRIEPGQLDGLPGEKSLYLRWQELEKGLARLLDGFPGVAMQYSERNSIPYVSKVDAGTVELVRSLQVEVTSSADLIQRLESVWDHRQLLGHRQTAAKLTRIVRQAFEKAARDLAERGQSSEYDLQQFILERFQQEQLQTDFPPIVAANHHSADPHYSPTPQRHDPIRPGDFLLIDVWARAEQPGAVFADITWTGYFGSRPPEVLLQVFETVRRARDRGTEFLSRRLKEGEPVSGWEVDDAVRRLIQEAGYGEAFVHRTGHNLGQEVHGSGVNFDNLETHDTRQVIEGLGCTIEPGIYLQDFGVRSEINVYFHAREVEVTTPPQQQLLLLSSA